MLRVQTLLKKLDDLATQKGEPSLIEVDLMMDYTRVIYADLVEMRSRLSFNNGLPVEMKPEAAQQQIIPQPQAEIKSEPSPVQITITEVPVTEILQQAPPVTIEEPVKPQRVPVAAQAPVTETESSVQSLIGINDTYLFMSELFDNEKDNYEHAIAKLNSFNNYQQAITWLHDNYLWDDEHQETSESFKTILQTFYKNR